MNMPLNMPPDHPLLLAVATSYSQGQGKMTRNLGQARDYLDAIPDGWVKVAGEWVQVEPVQDDGDPTGPPLYAVTDW